MKKQVAVIVLTALVLTFIGIVDSLAWDGEHKGFVIGGGVGPTAATLLTGQTDYKLVFQTNFKIGYAINNQWQIHYSGVTIWKMDNMLDHLTVGTTYYFQPQAPTFFASGGVGISYEIWQFFDGGFREGFPTVVAGFGYEFFKHVNIEATILTTSRQSDNELRWNYHLGINALVY